MSHLLAPQAMTALNNQHINSLTQQPFCSSAHRADTHTIIRYQIWQYVVHVIFLQHGMPFSPHFHVLTIQTEKHFDKQINRHVVALHVEAGTRNLLLAYTKKEKKKQLPSLLIFLHSWNAYLIGSPLEPNDYKQPKKCQYRDRSCHGQRLTKLGFFMDIQLM